MRYLIEGSSLLLPRPKGVTRPYYRRKLNTAMGRGDTSSTLSPSASPKQLILSKYFSSTWRNSMLRISFPNYLSLCAERILLPIACFNDWFQPKNRWNKYIMSHNICTIELLAAITCPRPNFNRGVTKPVHQLPHWPLGDFNLILGR